MELCFWLCAAVVGYTYVGYPLLLVVFARMRRTTPRRERFTGSVSVVLAARNESANLGRRLGELIDLLKATGVAGEIIVVSDGSTDDTAAVARSFADQGVRVIERRENLGKAVSLSEGCAAAVHDILVFADSRQRWDPQALGYLLENFADPHVGAVSGDLILESSPGVLAGVGLYWRFEKMLRRQESRLHSVVGVTGAICAVRRALFRAIPPGTLLDDVYWPLQVVLQGHRVIHDERAHAYDRLPDRAADEFRRKIRTLSGNWQLLARLPAALLPWRNPVWWQFVSHKLLRLAAPWALLGMLASSLWLLPELPYQVLLGAQATGYVLGLAGLLAPGRRLPLAGAAGSFLVLNTAAWLSFWVWITGRAGRSWHRVTYAPPLAPAQAAPETSSA